jgi:hypothetical protein
VIESSIIAKGFSSFPAITQGQLPFQGRFVDTDDEEENQGSPHSGDLYFQINNLVEKKLVSFKHKHEKKCRFRIITSIAVTAFFSLSSFLLARYLAPETK